ncbi:MAG: ankyrin repeat domain-containing protein [Prevotellaceae bacterium]|jgi:ankyrin repeat protein|nr:ankyrin repeat domain-containing protein [Prevotellaceae bacterium]
MQTYEIKRMYEQNDPKEDILNACQTALAENGNDYGVELITLAANFADVRALRLLVEAGIDPLLQDEYKHTLLHIVAKLDEARYHLPSDEDIKASVAFLLEQRVSVLRKDDNRYMCCYHYAAETGNYPFIATLAEHGAKLTMTDRDGNTAIHIAADYVKHPISSLQYTEDRVRKAGEELVKAANLGESWIKSAQKRVQECNEELQAIHKKIEYYFLTVKTLVESGVDKDEKNQYGRTALENAVESGAKKMAAYLNGEDVESGNAAIGGMNLHQAVIKDDLEAIAALLKNGADPNALLDGEPTDDSRNYLGCTPLAVACDCISVEAVKLLLQNGATPGYKNSEGKAPITWLLSTRGCKVSMQTVQKEKRVEQIIKAFIDAGYNINDTVNDDADTLVIYALKYAAETHLYHFDLEVVANEEAMCYRADFNLSNHAGQTPLMLACTKDREEIENTLLSILEAGVEVNARDTEGNTALHYTFKNRSKNTTKAFCELLLDFDADAAVANNKGETAMDMAVATENEPLVKLLLSKM